jgi:3-hydroxybutyryl-CoA dehydrogenase
VKSKKKQKKILVAGEPIVVKEVTDLCTSKGYSVTVLQQKSKSSPEAVRVPSGLSLALELTNIDIEVKERNLKSLDQKLPPDVPILSTSITTTITEQSSWVRRSGRLVGISGMHTFFQSGLIELAPAVYTSETALGKSRDFFWSIGIEVSVIRDFIGMVLPRIVCMLVNEAAFAVTENIANPEDIDLAMKLGTNYPYGPIEWGERIGFDQVLAVLSALHRELGDDRYRPAPILKELALTGGFWK